MTEADIMWTVRYRLERETPLDEAERATVLAHASEHAAGWATASYGLELDEDAPVVAEGVTMLPLDFTHADPYRFLSALTALQGLVVGSTCVIEDSRGLIGWDPLGHYALNAGVVSAPPAPSAEASVHVPGIYAAPTRPPVDPTPDDFFGSPMPKVEPALMPGEGIAGPTFAAAPAATAFAANVDPALAERIRKLVGHRDAWTERRALESQDPAAVALAALTVLRELPECYDVRAVLTTAIEKVVDRTPLRDAMVALWAEPAPRADWWRDAARALEPAASDPAVLAAVSSIILADAGDVDRRCAAVELLGYAGAAWADALPVLSARLRRDRDRSRDDARWRETAIDALGRLGRPEALPTIVLELSAETTTGWYPVVRAFGRAAGAEALPWLRRAFPCSGAAEYVIDALEDIPAAGDWLRELAASPEPRHRILAGRYLGRRGDTHLPWVAAIWKALDAVGYERTSGFREDAIEKLGGKRGEPEEDWDQLVRKRGLEPVGLPPLGDVLDGLLAPDDRRGLMLDRLGRDRPDPSLLLALILAIELDEALGRRGHRKASSPKWNEWAAVVPAWKPFAERYGYGSDMGDWIRTHRAELPPQRLTPALQQILDEGADAVAATMGDSRFLLAPEEAVMMDAAERAQIVAWEARLGARPGVAATPNAGAEPETMSEDASELFGVVLEPAPARRSLQPHPFPMAPLDGTENSEVLAFAPGSAALELELDDPTLPWLTIEGALTSRLSRPIKLASVELALRDASGGLSDVVRRVVRDQFWHQHLLCERLGFSEGSFDQARAVDVYVTHEVGFRTRVLVADLVPYDGEALDARTPWLHTLRTIEPSYPKFDARLAIFRPRADYLRCQFIVELAQRTPLRDASELDVLVVLRNRGGSVLEKSTDKVVLEAGGPTYVYGQLNLDLAQLRTARRLEVAVAGRTRRTERIAGFALRAPE